MPRKHSGNVDERAEYCLYKYAAPMTVAEVAADIDYSHGYTRKGLKELMNKGFIEGEKTAPVIACNIYGQTIVFTSSFDNMMTSLEAISEDLADKAKTEVTHGNMQELQAFIRRHGSSTYQIERRWEFWYPTATPPTGGSPSPAAPADD